jgi:hypothetical protein
MKTFPNVGGKGFVLTLDSILAMGFAIGLIAYLSYVSSTGVNIFPHAVAVQNYAEDLGALLSESGILSACANQSNLTSAAVMQSVISETLPADVSAQVSTSVYQYAPNGVCSLSCNLSGSFTANGFCLCKTIFAAQTVPEYLNDTNATYVGTANRIFYTTSSGSEYYGLAQVTVWAN